MVGVCVGGEGGGVVGRDGGGHGGAAGRRRGAVVAWRKGRSRAVAAGTRSRVVRVVAAACAHARRWTFPVNLQANTHTL